MTFNENEVNRDLEGKFSEKRGLSAEVALPVASEPVTVTISYDQWSGRRFASDYSSVDKDYDLRPVLDTFSTGELREFVENPHDADEVFYRAANSGLVEPELGEHGFEVQMDGVREYIRERESIGLDEPLAEDVVLDAPRRAAVYKRHASKALTNLIVPLSNGSANEASFANAHEAAVRSNEILENIIVSDDEAMTPGLRKTVLGMRELVSLGDEIELSDSPTTNDYARYLSAVGRQYVENTAALMNDQD